MVVDFPAPFAPRNAEDLAGRDREGQVVHGKDLAIAFG